MIYIVLFSLLVTTWTIALTYLLTYLLKCKTNAGSLSTSIKRTNIALSSIWLQISLIAVIVVIAHIYSSILLSRFKTIP